MAAAHAVPVEKVQARCLESALPPIITVETGTVGISCQSKYFNPPPSSVLCEHHRRQQVLGAALGAGTCWCNFQARPGCWAGFRNVGLGTSGRCEFKIVSSPPQIFGTKVQVITVTSHKFGDLVRKGVSPAPNMALLWTGMQQHFPIKAELHENYNNFMAIGTTLF